jgi:hypothetical protein
MATYVIFNIPPVGGSHEGDRRWGQIGPTCWYYAAKMLLRFHDLTTPEAGAIYEDYKALQEMRKALVELRGEEDGGHKVTRGQVTPSLHQAQYREQSRDIDKEAHEEAMKGKAFQSWWGKLNPPANEAKSSTQAKKPSPKHPKKPVEELTTEHAKRLRESIDKRLKEIKDPVIKKHATRLAAFDKALIALASIGEEEEIHRRVMLAKFFPEGTFVGLADAFDEKSDLPKLFDLLYAYGPMYVSGKLGPNKQMEVVDTDILVGDVKASDVKKKAVHQVAVPAKGGEVRTENVPDSLFHAESLRDKYVGEGQHAVVLAGVDTGQRLVYFKDPNHTDRLYRVESSVFFEKVTAKPFRGETQHFIALNPQKTDWENKRDSKTLCLSSS